ncbi:MAG: hypothetical protein G8345_01350 [Magnetococcales bacterium]|nr:zf-HC2 domain-containing protein [Magnetococcales bacterium]NGZ25516.1 hypothetical protein [Magnetococcales bacterium]
MKCNPELVSAFLDGELDDVILEAVIKHLMECEDCCQTLSHLAQVRDAITDQVTVSDPEAMTQSIMMAIQNERILPVKHTLHDRLMRVAAPVARAAAALSPMKTP